jgi:pimeloyl-ACP methyl ester carboxylesterase
MAAKNPNNRGMHILVISILLGIMGLFAYAASKFTPGKFIVILTGLGLLGFLATQVVYLVRARKLTRILQGVVLSVLAVTAGMYLLLFAFVLFFQDSVANKTASFFQPKTISAEAAQALVAADVTPLDLAAPDGHLRGWLVKSSEDPKTPLLIYFGGSGSESSEIIPYAKTLEGWSVALVNYRGFGQSDGTPSQSRVLDDAIFIYDMLIQRADIDASRVVVMGYSLGTGVAVSLAAQRPVAGVILVSPYNHWSLVGVNPSPIFKPLAGILKPYFDSISLAPGIPTSMLCLVGAADTAIPPALSHALSDAWGGKVTMMEYPGEDHHLLFNANNSWRDIQSFLASVQ